MTDYADDNGAPVAVTARWQRERGFTRASHVVVPDWPNLDPHLTGDHALALRFDIERVFADDDPALRRIMARAAARWGSEIWTQ